MEKILYAALNTIGRFDGEKIQKSDSGYIEKYRDNLIKIQKKNEWKYGGQSAAFQGRYHDDGPVEFYAAVNAVCPDGEEDCFYTVIAGEVSGVIAKNYETGRENHIYHSNQYKFYAAQSCPEAGLIVLSAAENESTKSVAVYNRNTNDLKFLTSGDALDDNPFWSGADGAIYYDSRGLGLNAKMEIVSVGPASIFKTDIDGTRCDEVLTETGFDLLCPKTDSDGNLYYIRRPYKNSVKKGGGGLFLDVILLPFRLVANIFRGLLYLSKLGKRNKERKNVNTFGDNPSVQKELSDFDLYVYGERIDAGKEEKANAKGDNKTAGFAPTSYELFRVKRGGEKELLRRGVLSYDIDPSGALYYSNGRYCLKAEDGGDRVIFKDKLILNVKVL
ncbi:hypothetical protein FACS1894211_13580 [Clostridia bacterium]|nr:hypothetical protein FACS1894211_13580 [Clostridia bacterium]